MRSSPLLLDPQALRTFATVARIGNLTRAAACLHRSQPAISLHLKNLSKATGLRLFRRTHAGVELTAEGAALLPLADKVLNAMAELSGAIHALQAPRGRLRIGTILDPEFTRVGVFLWGLARSHPHIEIALQQEVSGEVLDQVERGELDAGFFLNPPGASLDGPIACRPLTLFDYVVVAPRGWEPRVRGKGWSELARLPWVGTPPTSVHYRLQRRVFGPGSVSGMEPQRVAVVDQEPSMLDLVRSGLGLSLARDTIAMEAARTHGLVIADRVSLQCELSFICRSERSTEPAIVAALETLAEIWGTPGRADGRANAAGSV